MKGFAIAAACAIILCAQAVHRDAGRLFRERKYAESAAVLEHQVVDEPQNYAAWMLLGLCRLQTGEVAKAEQDFLTAQRLQPANAAVFYSLARTRFLLGRFDEAAAAAKEAGRRGESLARVHELLARIAQERGDFPFALDEYRAALHADPAFSSAASGEALILFRLGRYQEARSAAQAALRMNPANAEAKALLERTGVPSGGYPY
jgi:tetratricopeptide (TPR) repeat protein